MRVSQETIISATEYYANLGIYESIDSIILDALEYVSYKATMTLLLKDYCVLDKSLRSNSQQSISSFLGSISDS